MLTDQEHTELHMAAYLIRKVMRAHTLELTGVEITVFTNACHDIEQAERLLGYEHGETQ